MGGGGYPFWFLLSKPPNMLRSVCLLDPQSPVFPLQGRRQAGFRTPPGFTEEGTIYRAGPEGGRLTSSPLPPPQCGTQLSLGTLPSHLAQGPASGTFPSLRRTSPFSARAAGFQSPSPDPAAPSSHCPVCPSNPPFTNPWPAGTARGPPGLGSMHDGPPAPPPGSGALPVVSSPGCKNHTWELRACGSHTTPGMF